MGTSNVPKTFGTPCTLNSNTLLLSLMDLLFPLYFIWLVNASPQAL